MPLMPVSVHVPSDQEILQERMVRQGLTRRSAGSVADAVRTGAGLQAQDGAAATLGVRARCASADAGTVTAALETDRTVVRTWAMRATVHLVGAADVGWMTRLLGPGIRRRFETVRWPQLGLTAPVLDHAAELAADVLTDGPLPRLELIRRLAQSGLPVEPTSEVGTHVALFLST